MDSLFNNIKGVIKARYFKSPFFVKFEATNACNHKCCMCSRWKDYKKEDELSLERIEKIAENLKKLKVTDVSLTGGEIFLRKDILDLIKIFKERKINIRLQTNGGPHVTKELLDKVIGTGVKNIGVSLHTLNKDQLSLITGGEEVLDNAIKTIKYISKRIPWPIVNIVVTKLNIQEVPSIVDFANRLGAYSHTIPISMPKKTCGDKRIIEYLKQASFKGIDPKIVDQVYDQLKLMKKKNYRILHSLRYLEECRGFIKTGNKKFNCYAGESFFIILPNGTLKPCEKLSLTYDATSSNLIKFLRSEVYLKKLGALRKRCEGCECGNYHEYSYIMNDNEVLIEGAYRQLLFKMKRLSESW